MNTFTLKLRQFAHEHDDLPAFHAAYLVLAFLTAMLFNLGAFGLLIVVHITLDVFKYREVHGFSWHDTWRATIRESLVDVTLFMVGLVFTVYLHHSVGVASLSGLMRADIALMRVIATTVPKLKILHHFLKVMAHLRHYLETVHPHATKEWTAIDILCFVFCGASFLLLLLAAPLMHIDLAVEQQILLDELIPWRL